MLANDIFMGQQISHAGDENLDAVDERGARVDLAEVYYGYVSSRVEKLIKLARSSLATQVHDRSQSQQSSNIRQQGASMISSPLVAVHNTHPSHFTDIPTVNLSCNTDDYDVGVAVSEVLLEPVELRCHVPVRKTHIVDTCCQTVDESQLSTRVNGAFECLLAEASEAESEAFSSMNDGVIPNEVHEATSKWLGEIFLSRNGLEVNAKSGVCDAEPHCRSRPPQRTKSITTPETVLQSAYESRPPEIGSYLAVAPVVSSSDLGLSPIDETAEVVATNTFANTFSPCATTKQTPHKSLSRHISSDAFPSHYDHTRLQSSLDIIHSSKMSDPQNSVVYSFKNNPLTSEATLSQSNAGFLRAEGSNSVQVLETVQDTARDGKFSEDACHSPANSCFTALESGSDETDRCAGTGNKSTVQVDTYSSWALQDKDAVFSDRTVTEHAKSDIITSDSIPFNCQHYQSESRTTFPSEAGSCYSPQTSTPHFVLADRLNLSNNREVDVKESERCDIHHSPALDLHTAGHGTSNVDTSAFGSVWNEWETALSCDFSTNNNESGNPKIAVINMSPDNGPFIARRQVRHCSDSSAPLSSSLPSTANCHLRPLPARSTSQLSLDDVIVSPRAVPERLNFQQLEKFEGRYFFYLLIIVL